MQKLKLILIPICVGAVLLFISWYLSYPVSIDSPYDFAYNHISYLYWVGLAILFFSFFVVATKTENNSLRWAMAIGTVLLMFSQTYFYYMVPGSDSHQFRGLTEYYISTGDLSLQPHHSYYEWPLFFLLNKIVISITGLDLRYCEFILYGTTCSIITSFIYLHVSKVQKNAYIAVIAFFIILTNFFNFQFWAAFTLSLCYILLLLYLDSMTTKREVLPAMLIIFAGMTYTQILTPLFFVIYSLVMYILKKNRKYLNLFILTSIIYAFVLSKNLLFAYYMKRLTDLFFQEILHRITVTTASSIAPQPYVDVIAQLFSRSVTVTTVLVTGLGFVVLVRRKKLRGTDYAMLLTGAIFAATILVTPSSYHNLSNRSYFLLCIPASMGAAYLCESKLRKYFVPAFMVFLLLFTFVIMHKTFYDQEIQFQTKAEYQCANFMIGTTNWNTPASVLSPFRFMKYLTTKSSTDPNVVVFEDDSSARALGRFPENMTYYTYVAYTIGLAKSSLAANYSVEESFMAFEVNHFNLIYNSGNFSYIFSK